MGWLFVLCVFFLFSVCSVVIFLFFYFNHLFSGFFKKINAIPPILLAITEAPKKTIESDIACALVMLIREKKKT